MRPGSYVTSCIHAVVYSYLIYSSLFFILPLPTAFLPRNFRPPLTENTHYRHWREPKGLDSPKWMRQIRYSLVHLSNILIRDFEDDSGIFYIKTWSPDTIYCGSAIRILAFIGLLARFDWFILFITIKAVSASGSLKCQSSLAPRTGHLRNREVIYGPQALSPVLDCKQKASFYDMSKWELLW